MKPSRPVDMWVLLGPHRGDNNQVLALAEALHINFRTIDLRYRWFAHVPAALRMTSIFQLERGPRLELRPPWPAIVLGIGQRSAPVARYIQRASGGYSKTVRLGDPMVSHELFNLVITTTQYAVRDAANVVRLPATITAAERVQPDETEERWLQNFARPIRLLVIGGRTSLWRVGPDLIADAARALQARAAREGGSVIAVTSPRTSKLLAAAAEAELGKAAVVRGAFPRYAALLSAADEVHVTGDSVSMLSDAVASGKPVGLIPLQLDIVGRFVQFVGKLRGRPFRIRDLESFWIDLRRRGLVGTIDAPVAGTLEPAPVECAVEAIRQMLAERATAEMPSRNVPADEPLDRRARATAVLS